VPVAPRSFRPSSRLRVFAVLFVCPFVAGCFGPLRANINLRKQNEKQREQIAKLEAQHQADQQRMLALERQATTVPVLPNSRLAHLFTAQGLAFGRLTGGASSKENLGYDDLVKVYVTPTDQDGQSLKAAGSFRVSVFDLSQPEKPLLATREFSVQEAMAAWYGQALLYNYVLEVPLTRFPSQPDVLISVAFTDELTQRTITAERKIVLSLPPTTQPRR